MGTDTKSRVMSGLIWRYAERCGAQLIQFVVSVVLARMLTPSDYGLIGIITVFISLSNVFVQSGMGQALVQRKNADEVDFSTVFYYTLAISVILYFGLYAAAPYIANFYDAPVLKPVVRVLGTSIIVGSLNGVQNAYVQKHMQFKRFFYSTIIGILVSAVVGLVMAYKGFGVWALVAQQLVNQVVNTLVLWFTVKWRPILKFSFSKMKNLFSFGWKLLCSNLIDTLYRNIYTLVIGKVYSSADLGYYNKGKSFPMLIINNINTTLNTVLLPVMSEAQNEKERLKAMVRRSIVTTTFFIFPAMAGLAAVAKPLTILMLTEKWLPAVPFIQFCCFAYAFWPVHTANLQAITALGRSDIFLKLEIIKKVIAVIVLISTIPYGLTVMMIARCLNAVLSSFINAFPNKKLLGYSYIEQVKDMLPAAAISVVMLVCVIPITLLPISPVIQLIIQVVLGVLIYIGLARIFKLDSFEYTLNILKNLIKKDK